MSSSTPTRKYSAGNGPRPGFHRQVNTLFYCHCDQYHGGHGGLGGHSYLDGRNSHCGPRPRFHRQVTAFLIVEKFVVVIVMMVVSVVMVIF